MLSHPNLTETEAAALESLRAKLTDLLGHRLRGFILFGSKARGDYDEESDLDVAIIVEGLDRSLKRTIIDMVIDIEIKHDVIISSWVVSSREFNDLRDRERRIALDIEREGIKL